MSGLLVAQLSDPSGALEIVEEILALDPKESPTLMALGEPGAKSRVQVVGILEQILRDAPRVSIDEPLDRTDRTSLPPSKGKRSLPPPRARAKKVPARQRAAALLKEHYRESGHDAELAATMEVELEAVRSVKERIRRHNQIAEIYFRLNANEKALDHYVALVALEPDVQNHRTMLSDLAERIQRFDRMADVLATAAEDCTDDELRVELLMLAATTCQEKLREFSRAIEFYLRVLSVVGCKEEIHLEAARRVAPLLLDTGRSRERLEVLERLAHLEPDLFGRMNVLVSVAELATELGELDRAVLAWETRLAEDAADLVSLNGLILLYSQAGRVSELIAALERRSEASANVEGKRADRELVAALYEERIQNLDKAITTWREIEADFGPTEASTETLVRLYTEAERWSDLSAHLSSAANRASPVARPSLFARLGDVERERLDEPERAITSYAMALELVPTHPSARNGLESFLLHPSFAPRAVEELLTVSRSRSG